MRGLSEAAATPRSLRLGDVRVPFAAEIAVAIAVAAFAVLLYLTRHFTFFYDEWDWVLGSPTWNLASYFQPHSEHWSTIPMAVYKVLFSIFGARHYLPFMVPVLTLHAGVLLEVFRIVRRRSGDFLALAAVIALALFGRGYENLLWGFQVGFVGSVFFGLVAIDLLDVAAAPAWRWVAASAALNAALMSSGVGLFFLGAVGIELLFDPGRRPRLAVLAAPLAAYLAWVAFAGHGGISSHRSPFSLSALESLGAYVPYGVAAATAGLFGFPPDDAWLALTALLALLAVGVVERPSLVNGRTLAAAGGLVLQFGLTGLVRAELGVAQAASTRYVYVGSVFLLLLLTQFLAAVPARRGVLVAVAGLTVTGFLLNAAVLRDVAHAKNAQFNQQIAELQTLELFRHSPDLVPSSRPDPVLMPTVTSSRYFAAIDKLGSPVAPVTLEQLNGLPAYAVDGVLRQVLVLAYASASGVATGCSAATGSAPAGSWLQLGQVTGSADVYLWYVGLPPATPSVQYRHFPLDKFSYLRLPRTAPAIRWHFGVATQPPAPVEVCSGLTISP